MDLDRELDGIQVNLSYYLTKREYYSNVIFTSDLLFDLYMDAIDARIYYWPINDREGIIQKGDFKIKETTLSWAIIYRHYAKNKRKIIMNFGDLLVHVPYTERLKWKKYLLEVELENLTKLLFYDLKIPKERDSYIQFWKERTKHSLSQVEFVELIPRKV